MIPKSLHTVTVLVQLTLHFYGEAFTNGNRMTLEQCLNKAVFLLGYADSPDVHGLTLQALKKLRK